MVIDRYKIISFEYLNYSRTIARACSGFAWTYILEYSVFSTPALFLSITPSVPVNNIHWDWTRRPRKKVRNE